MHTKFGEILSTHTSHSPLANPSRRNYYGKVFTKTPIVTGQTQEMHELLLCTWDRVLLYSCHLSIHWTNMALSNHPAQVHHRCSGKLTLRQIDSETCLGLTSKQRTDVLNVRPKFPEHEWKEELADNLSIGRIFLQIWLH